MRDVESAARRDAAASRDEQIRVLVERLGRPHPAGGTVIERAALMAEGADLDRAVAWILARGGRPETGARTPPRRGLYGSASDGGGAATESAPRRFVLPPGALAPPERDAPDA